MTVAHSQDSTARNISVHRVISDWGEGHTVAPGNGGGGGFAQAGDATWVHRYWPLQPWSSAGGDFNALPAAVAQMPPGGSLRVRTTTSLVLDVQGWLTGSLPNYGWLLRSDDPTPATARRIHSSESPIAASQPQLHVGFVPPGTVLSVGLGCIGSGGLEFSQDILGAPIGGTSISIGMSGGLAQGLGVTLIGLGIAPVPFTLEHNCSLFLLPSSWLNFGWRHLDSSGSVSNTYPIPNDSNLNGAVWALQSVGFDSGIPRGFVLSNAHLLVFR